MTDAAPFVSRPGSSDMVVSLHTPSRRHSWVLVACALGCVTGCQDAPTPPGAVASFPIAASVDALAPAQPIAVVAESTVDREALAAAQQTAAADITAWRSMDLRPRGHGRQSLQVQAATPAAPVNAPVARVAAAEQVVTTNPAIRNIPVSDLPVRGVNSHDSTLVSAETSGDVTSPTHLNALPALAAATIAPAEPVAPTSTVAPANSATAPIEAGATPSPGIMSLRLANADTLLRQARVKHQQGTTLATRGALFVARNEFLQSLQLIAQAADASTGIRTRELAFKSALRAFEEFEEFHNRHGASIAQPDLVVLVRSHRTKAISPEEASDISTSEAQIRYLQVAGQGLYDAFAGLPVAATPLHSVGRVYDLLSPTASTAAAHDKALIFYEAALAIDVCNLAATNDLGVLLANQGRLPEARQLLTRCVTQQPNAASYHNLAVVLDRLGEPGLGAQARRAAQAATSIPGSLDNPALTPWQHVQWLNTSAFAQTSSVTSDVPPEALGPATIPTAAANVPQVNTSPRTATRDTTRSPARWQQ